MSTNDDGILDQSLRLLRAHCHAKWGDRVPIDVFNRLLAKSIKADGWKDGVHMNIKRNQIRSPRETRTTEELALLERSHHRLKPCREDCPIIIAVYESKERLLDGTTRINLWERQKNKERHDVNVHIVETE